MPFTAQIDWTGSAVMETACVDGHSRLSVVIDPGHIRIKVKVCACVMCVQYTIIIFHPAS